MVRVNDRFSDFEAHVVVSLFSANMECPYSTKVLGGPAGTYAEGVTILYPTPRTVTSSEGFTGSFSILDLMRFT